MTTRVAENLFTGTGDATRLIAGRRKLDGKLVFPMPGGPEGAAFDAIELGHKGALWSWTVQRFLPKPPYNGRGAAGDFKPYGVGYVELPGELIVEGRILADDFATLRIGQPMKLTTEPYRDGDDGEPVLTYAFTPDREEAAHP